MNKLQIRNSFLLLLAAVIWGVAFVAQSVGMEYVGAFTFTCVRSWIGGFVLIPCIYFLKKINKEEKKECIKSQKELETDRKNLILSGILCGIVTVLPMFLIEQPSLHGILSAWKPILYAGVLSSGGGYTLQIVGQKGMNPTVASLILSLESVVSVIAGLLILEEKLSTKETIGCILMFIAIVLAQLPEKKKP